MGQSEENKDDQLVICLQCGNELGRVHLVEGEELIQIGALVVSEIDGNCAQCGNEFHYSINASRLERLINRVTLEKVNNSG